MSDSKNKTLFVTRQVGTVTAFLPVVYELIKLGKNFSIVAYEQSKAEWSRLGFKELLAFENLSFDEYSFILTGTSLLTKEDYQFWKVGENLNIPSAAFVDSWANYAERFTKLKPFDCLPKFILVVDQLMKNRMLEYGAPEHKIQIVGHPRFEALKKEVLPKVKTKNSKKTIVFFTDPVLINSKNTFNTAGYEPVELTKIILNEFANSNFDNLNFTVLVKNHPRENKQDYLRVVENCNSSKILFSQNENSTELLKLADVVLGFNSILLLDASTLGIPTFSFQPERKIYPNDITDNRSGIKLVLSTGEIKSAIKKIIDSKNTTRVDQKDIIQNKLSKFVLKFYTNNE